jgi:uncharacterized protein YjbJ (UPF0337 family)
MGADKKVHNAGQGLWSRAKELVGQARGDRPQRNAARREQRRVHVKKAAEHVKDAGKK